MIRSFAVLLLLVAGLPGQTTCTDGASTCGEGAFFSGSTVANDPAVIYANAFLQGTDLCDAIAQAIAHATPNQGRVIDARGLTESDSGSANCMTNPFANLPMSGTGVLAVELWLGPITFRTTVMWTLNSQVRIIGDGATAIQAFAGFTDPAVVQFGDASVLYQASPFVPLFGVGLQDLTVDCNKVASVGIRNQASQEQTSVERVKITGCLDTGLDITASGAQNSGPYRDLEIAAGSSATANTTCVRLGVASDPSLCPKVMNTPPAQACVVYSVRGIDGLTCDLTGSSVQPLVGLDISGQGGRYRNIFVKGPATGIQLGSDSNANGITLENVRGASVGSLVAISAGSAIANYYLSGLQLQGSPPPGTLIINDVRGGVKYCDQSIALYAQGASPAAAITTATDNYSPFTFTLPGDGSVTGGQAVVGTLTAAQLLWVSFSSSTSAATVPHPVLLMPPNTTFTISTFAVASPTKATITATGGCGITQAQLTVNPPSLSKFTIFPAKVKGGIRTTGTVTLSGLAPGPNGAKVFLSSSKKELACVHGSVTVRPGQTSAPFSITTYAVTKGQTVFIKASYRKNSLSASVILTK